MAAHHDQRIWWRSHAVVGGVVVDRKPAPFPATVKRQPRRHYTSLSATQGDFDRATVNRRRKFALASKRRNRA